MSRDRRPYDKQLRSAEKKFRLSNRLKDPRKLIAALRYYDANLKPGQWVELKPPRREGYRKLNPGWSNSLTAARRILGVVARRMRITPLEELMLSDKAKREITPRFTGVPLRDGKGRPRLAFYLRRDVWETIQARLCRYTPAA